MAVINKLEMQMQSRSAALEATFEDLVRFLAFSHVLVLPANS